MKPVRAAGALGLDPYAVYSSVRGLAAYRRNRREFRRQAAQRSEWIIGSDWPFPADRRASGGVARGQYFHQDLWVAQLVHDASPRRHVDVGSRVDGFVAHVATFMPIEVLDIRPIPTTAANISFAQRDVMQVDAAFDGYTESLSCLHTLEHFGLGRYGDVVDYDGYRIGFENLARMVEVGGRFYFSVPISRRPRIEFDAHRLFSVPMVVELVDTVFDVERAAVVDDSGELRTGIDVRSPEAADSFQIEYGCVVLVLRKR